MTKAQNDAEYEIYIPVYDNQGNAYPKDLLLQFREKLVNKFGGLTDTRYRNEGIWKVGFVQIKDEVVVWRVLSLSEGPQDSFMSEFKKNLEDSLKQDKILIVRRLVSVL